MRFSTARRAYTIDVNVSGVDTRQTVDVPAGDGTESGKQYYVSTRLGVRNYRALGKEVVSFVGFGPRVALGGSSNRYGSVGRTSNTTWETGGFVDYGVAAAVQRRLLLGATTGVSAGYLRSRSKNRAASPAPGHESRSTASQWFLSAGLLRLEATVLF